MRLREPGMVRTERPRRIKETPWQRYVELGFSPWPAHEILAYMDRMGYHYRIVHGEFEPVSPSSLTPGLLASIDYRRAELTRVVKMTPVAVKRAVEASQGRQRAFLWDETQGRRG